MTASKRPSTSSLRRFITTRSYVTIAELRRRFSLDEPDVCCLQREGHSAFVGLPEREALKLQELWVHDEIGLEMSVEVRAPVVIGIYPMHIARFIQEQYANGVAVVPNGPGANGHAPAPNGNGDTNGQSDGHTNGHANEPVHGDLDRRGNGDLNAFATQGFPGPSRDSAGAHPE